MPPSARSDDRALRLGLAGIAALTLWRVALLPFDSADLYVDEAQYWFWGQTLDWGYYSKPPLIAWILRLSTTIGSDAPFWIHLPLPLIHAATAVLVALVARRLLGPRAGGIAGFAYASFPAVALASLLVSTDTPMLACFALALLAHVHLTERRSLGWAVVLGAAVGAGLMAKYAMIYFPISAALAALALPNARIAWRDAGVAALVALALVAPNLIWNAANQFATLHHTADNADWHGLRLDFDELAGFLAGQFAVAGPVFFAAYLAGLPRAFRDPVRGYLAMMSLPAFAVVSVQALLSGANANWAAAGHLAALVLAVAVLARRRRLLAAGLAVNLGLALALPVAAVFADSWRIGQGNLVLARYVGQSALSRKAAEVAREAGLDTLVSGNRAMLADFFYTLRDSGLAIYAEPVEGFPPHHYAQKVPLPPGPGDVLYVTRDRRRPGLPRGGRLPGRGRLLAAGTRLHHSRDPRLPGPQALLVPGRLGCRRRATRPRHPPFTPFRMNHGHPRPPPRPDLGRAGPPGRAHLQPALLPGIRGAGLARHRPAAHRLRPLRQQGGGQPGLHLGLAGGARLHLRHPARRGTARAALDLHARLRPPRPLRRPPRPRRGAGARRSACSAAPPARRSSISPSASTSWTTSAGASSPAPSPSAWRSRPSPGASRPGSA